MAVHGYREEREDRLRKLKEKHAQLEKPAVKDEKKRTAVSIAVYRSNWKIVHAVIIFKCIQLLDWVICVWLMGLDGTDRGGYLCHREREQARSRGGTVTIFSNR